MRQCEVLLFSLVTLMSVWLCLIRPCQGLETAREEPQPEASWWYDYYQTLNYEITSGEEEEEEEVLYPDEEEETVFVEEETFEVVEHCQKDIDCIEMIGPHSVCVEVLGNSTDTQQSKCVCDKVFGYQKLNGSCVYYAVLGEPCVDENTVCRDPNARCLLRTSDDDPRCLCMPRYTPVTSEEGETVCTHQGVLQEQHQEKLQYIDLVTSYLYMEPETLPGFPLAEDYELRRGQTVFLHIGMMENNESFTRLHVKNCVAKTNSTVSAVVIPLILYSCPYRGQNMFSDENMWQPVEDEAESRTGPLRMFNMPAGNTLLLECDVILCSPDTENDCAAPELCSNRQWPSTVNLTESSVLSHIESMSLLVGFPETVHTRVSEVFVFEDKDKKSKKKDFLLIGVLAGFGVLVFVLCIIGDIVYCVLKRHSKNRILGIAPHDTLPKRQQLLLDWSAGVSQETLKSQKTPVSRVISGVSPSPEVLGSSHKFSSQHRRWATVTSYLSARYSPSIQRQVRPRLEWSTGEFDNEYDSDSTDELRVCVTDKTNLSSSEETIETVGSCSETLHNDTSLTSGTFGVRVYPSVPMMHRQQEVIPDVRSVFLALSPRVAVARDAEETQLRPRATVVTISGKSGRVKVVPLRRSSQLPTFRIKSDPGSAHRVNQSNDASRLTSASSTQAPDVSTRGVRLHYVADEIEV